MQNSEKPQLHLASSSPRRRDILEALGLSFTVEAIDIDETPLAEESAEEMVLRLAAEKAAAAKAGENRYVLGSDTAVVLDDKVLGKPADRREALRMLLDLSGRQHAVVTGVALRGPAGMQTAMSSTDVQFREISRDEALAYWHSGEPRDKAGAYGIQGRGGMFVAAISGSYSGVMGLPVYETAGLLRAAGFELLARRKDDGG